MKTPRYLGTIGENVKLGSDLTPEQQNEVKRRYVNRFTKDHKPAWATNEPVQFASDEDWLANTFFAVTSKGQLLNLGSACESHPTYPDGNTYQ